MLLVDKYAPNRIEDLLGNEGIVQLVKDIKDTFPHLLLSGPPGTGKTTLAHLIKTDFETLELNASDERGIDTIRTTLKGFCHKNVSKKLVILDECDHLTTPAQQALRRLMETTDTRFILICNRITQVIEPIQSRCAALKFERIPVPVLKQRLLEVCQAEGIRITDEGLEAVLHICQGDIRAGLGCLQGLVALRRVVDDDFIYRLHGIPNGRILEGILAKLKVDDTEGALEIFHELWELHFESTDILDGFFRIGKNQDNFELMKIVGKYQLRINEGVNSKIQFYSMLGEIRKISISS